MVINKFLKSRLNKGLPLNVYDWQNRNRKEIDIILDRPNGPIAIEVKSGSTMSQSYFSNLEYWKTLSKDESSASYVIYGGDKNMTLGNNSLISWRKMSSLIDELSQLHI